MEVNRITKRLSAACLLRIVFTSGITIGLANCITMGAVTEAMATVATMPTRRSKGHTSRAKLPSSPRLAMIRDPVERRFAGMEVTVEEAAEATCCSALLLSSAVV